MVIIHIVSHHPITKLSLNTGASFIQSYKVYVQFLTYLISYQQQHTNISHTQTSEDNTSIKSYCFRWRKGYPMWIYMGSYFWLIMRSKDTHVIKK